MVGKHGTVYNHLLRSESVAPSSSPAIKSGEPLDEAIVNEAATAIIDHSLVCRAARKGPGTGYVVKSLKLGGIDILSQTRRLSG